MVRCVMTAFVGNRPAAAVFAAVASLSCSMGSARAEASLPASASVVRNAVVALSLADAALPFADAAVMKSGASDAMASMRPASTRRYTTASVTPVYDRRVRSYRDPFLLIVGIAY